MFIDWFTCVIIIYDHAVNVEIKHHVLASEHSVPEASTTCVLQSRSHHSQCHGCIAVNNDVIYKHIYIIINRR